MTRAPEPVTEEEILRAERDAALALVTLLRADLKKLADRDVTICEGCGAPLDHDEDHAFVEDVRGCWGFAADVKGAPCWRYRTEEGADRAWPSCRALEAAAAVRRARDGEGGR